MSVNKIETTLKELLAKAVIEASLTEDIDAKNIVIEIPKDVSHGDYSSNIAMQLTKLLKRNPREIAKSIVEKIDTVHSVVSKVEIAGPGFINLFIQKSAMTSIIKEVIDFQDDYGKSNYGQGIKYNVEFVSANPTGDLHLGHAKGGSGWR